MLLGDDLMNVIMEDFIIKHFGVARAWVVKYWRVNDGFCDLLQSTWTTKV